jgi:medium-chain acyl-[acyl-carrier-protein] hydrolase
MERPLSSVAEIVDRLRRDLAADMDVPFALFGHSFGSLVCFELARALEREDGLVARRLFVSAHPAPHLPQRGPRVHDQPDAALAAELRRLAGTPSELLRDSELLALLLPAMRADYTASETYVHADMGPLSCPITALGGCSDPETHEAELAGWRQHTKGRTTVHVLSGNHFFLRPRRKEVVEIIGRELASAAEL